MAYYRDRKVIRKRVWINEVIELSYSACYKTDRTTEGHKREFFFLLSFKSSMFVIHLFVKFFEPYPKPIIDLHKQARLKFMTCNSETIKGKTDFSQLQ